MAAKGTAEWIKGAEALSRMCISERTLARLVDEGRIGVLRIPGVKKVMYSRLDVEAMVSAGTHPARRPVITGELVEA